MSNSVWVSQLASTSAFGCLQSNGYSGALIRAYRTILGTDPNFTANIQNVQSAGMTAGAWVSLVGQMPTTDAATVAQKVKDANVQDAVLWLDTSGANYWPSDQSSAQSAFTSLLAAFKATGLSLGISTAASDWSSIFGADFSPASDLPLMYAHFDGVQSFSDFAPFGGWSTPTAKTYSGDTRLCGVQIDRIWQP